MKIESYISTTILILIITIFGSSCGNDSDVVGTSLLSAKSTKLPLDWKIDCEEILVIQDYVVNGDFDGDNRIESLKYHMDNDSGKIEKIEFEISNNNIPKFEIQIGQSCCGLHHLKNEGNLDKHPGEEISLVIANNDFSNLNLLKIYGLRNQEWKELIDIPIWEWQIDGLDKMELIEMIQPNKIKVKMRTENTELVDTMLRIE